MDNDFQEHLSRNLCFHVINITSLTSSLEMSKKVCLRRFLTSQTLPIVFRVTIPSVSKFVISLTVMLHIAYLTRQEAEQAFIPTCKSMIDLANLVND